MTVKIIKYVNFFIVCVQPRGSCFHVILTLGKKEVTLTNPLKIEWTRLSFMRNTYIQ